MYCSLQFSLPHAVSFNPDSHFSMEAISKLEHLDITFSGDFKQYERSLQSVLGIDLDDSSGFSIYSLLKEWLQQRASLIPTWRHLFWALREVRLNYLADKMETYLEGKTVEQVTHPVTVEEGADEISKGKI